MLFRACFSATGGFAREYRAQGMLVRSISAGDRARGDPVNTVVLRRRLVQAGVALAAALLFGGLCLCAMKNMLPAFRPGRIDPAAPMTVADGGLTR